MFKKWWKKWWGCGSRHNWQYTWGTVTINTVSYFPIPIKYALKYWVKDGEAYCRAIRRARRCPGCKRKQIQKMNDYSYYDYDYGYVDLDTEMRVVHKLKV